MEYAGLLALGYSIGSLPFGYIIAAAHGIEISKVGSGSSGSTNIMRALGLKWGLLVMALDILKGAGAVVTALALGHEWMFSSAVLFAAAVGHAYPICLWFRGGGKSVNTIVGGMALIASWQVFLVVLTVWLFLFAKHKLQKKFIISLVNLTVLVPGIPIGLGLSYLSWQWGLIGFGFSIFLCWTHRDNIKRLLRGEEKPLEILNKKNSR